jgi:hypothetical protein
MENKSRLIALKKKDKPPDKVTNLRDILILPVHVRLLEQSYGNLTNRLKDQPESYAFLPNKSTMCCIRNRMFCINNFDYNIIK